MEDAVAALRRGGVIGIPTDTVYGVASVLSATDGLFAAKHRPKSVDLPVLVASIEQAAGLGDLGSVGRELAERHWPGGLTIVVPRAAGFEADLGASRDTVGLRMPDHPVPLELCRTVGPLATTSANLHGMPPATTAEDVRAQLGDGVALVVDGGVCDGEPSTVVSVVDGEVRVLRQGAVVL